MTAQHFRESFDNTLTSMFSSVISPDPTSKYRSVSAISDGGGKTVRREGREERGGEWREERGGRRGERGQRKEGKEIY